VRPSGTEPKIKFYFALKSEVEDDVEKTRKWLENRFEEIWKDMISRCGLE